MQAEHDGQSGDCGGFGVTKLSGRGWWVSVRLAALTRRAQQAGVSAGFHAGLLRRERGERGQPSARYLAGGLSGRRAAGQGVGRCGSRGASLDEVLAEIAWSRREEGCAIVYRLHRTLSERVAQLD